MPVIDFKGTSKDYPSTLKMIIYSLFESSSYSYPPPPVLNKLSYEEKSYIKCLQLLKVKKYWWL